MSKIKRICDGKVLVWKEIQYGEMSEEEKEQLVREVNLLREFRHPNIVRYYNRIIDRALSRLYIVMEYCPGGDLESLIKKHRTSRKWMKEDFVWKIMYHLLLALHELHKTRQSEGGKVLHRDIKPANVFLDSDNNAKLGDFGLARILHNTSLAKTFVGSPCYMSPELFSFGSYDDKCDLWSLGCLVYELCALSPPFNADTPQQLSKHVCAGHFTRIPSQFSDDLQSIIASLLHLNPDRRPSISWLLNTIEERGHWSIEGSPPGAHCTAPKLKSDLLLERKEKELLKREFEVSKREELVAIKERELIAREKRLLSLETRLSEKAFKTRSRK